MAPTKARLKGSVGEKNLAATKTTDISKPHISMYGIYLHLVDLYGKCGQIYHTWILWEPLLVVDIKD